MNSGAGSAPQKSRPKVRWEHGESVESGEHTSVPISKRDSSPSLRKISEECGRDNIPH